MVFYEFGGVDLENLEELNPGLLGEEILIGIYGVYISIGMASEGYQVCCGVGLWS